MKKIFLLLFLELTLLVFSLDSWLRFQQAIVNWTYLISLGVVVLPLYLAVSGAVWGLVSLAAAVGLWFYQRWAVIVTGAGALLFTIWYWLDRLFLAPATGGSQANLWFAVVINAVLLVLVYLNLGAVWETIRYERRETSE
ncbi:MAG TPA: hypothetical protein VMC62_04960 [Longilinea sp.]|nr:hypothetical protein [Longilinea sp.]